MLPKRAYILLDALVGAAMLALILAALLPTIGLLNIKASKSNFETEAASILVSGMEIAYTISLSDWNSLVVDQTYVVGTSGSTWLLSPGASQLEHAKFTRVIQILAVCRDTDGDQTTCPSGTTDPDSKTIKVTVSWDESGVAKQIDSQLLIYNYN